MPSKLNPDGTVVPGTEWRVPYHDKPQIKVRVGPPLTPEEEAEEALKKRMMSARDYVG